MSPSVPQGVVRVTQAARDIANAKKSRDALRKLIPAAMALAAGGSRLVRALIELDAVLHKFIDNPDEHSDADVNAAQLQASVDQLREELAKLVESMPDTGPIIDIPQENTDGSQD